MILQHAEPGTTSPTTSRPGDLHRLGVIAIVAGALGAASAAGVLLTPPVVGPDRFSYPFDPTGHIIAQLVFAVQHLIMIAGVLGLARLAPWSLSRVWRVGLILAGGSLALLIGCEIFGIFAASAAEGSPIATAVSAAYGLPTVLVGVGFVMCGWVVARRRLLTWGAWLPFSFGLSVFVVLLPALSAPHVFGRLALGAWMVVYLLIGVALRRQARG